MARGTFSGRVAALAVVVLLGNKAAGFSPVLPTSTTALRKSVMVPRTHDVSAGVALMFIDGLKDIVKKPAAADGDTPDTTTLGTLIVPSVGIGTISWSSTSRKCVLDAV